MGYLDIKYPPGAHKGPEDLKEEEGTMAMESMGEEGKAEDWT